MSSYERLIFILTIVLVGIGLINMDNTARSAKANTEMLHKMLEKVGDTV